MRARAAASGDPLQPQPTAADCTPQLPAVALRSLPLPDDYAARVTTQFQHRAPGYDTAAPAYHEPLALRLAELAALRPGERVVDVACGTGLVALAAARAVGATGRVLGLDLSPAMLERAAANAATQGANVEWRAGDADGADPGEGCWEAVLCSSALPFFPNIPATLARWACWLRPGGRAAFNAPKVGIFEERVGGGERGST